MVSMKDMVLPRKQPCRCLRSTSNFHVRASPYLTSADAGNVSVALKTLSCTKLQVMLSQIEWCSRPSWIPLLRLSKEWPFLTKTVKVVSDHRTVEVDLRLESSQVWWGLRPDRSCSNSSLLQPSRIIFTWVTRKEMKWLLKSQTWFIARTKMLNNSTTWALSRSDWRRRTGRRAISKSSSSSHIRL